MKSGAPEGWAVKFVKYQNIILLYISTDIDILSNCLFQKGQSIMDKTEKLTTCTRDEEKQFHYTQTITNNVNKT